MSTYVNEPHTNTAAGGQTVSAHETPALNTTTGTNVNTTTATTTNNNQEYTHQDTNYPAPITENNGVTDTGYETKTGTYFVRNLFLMVLRFFQFAASAIVLGLLCYYIHTTGIHGAKDNFGIATSGISLFYLILIMCALLIMASFVMPGVFFILEIIVTLLWLAAFIVLAKRHGSHSCSSSPMGISSRACNAGQASIAFSGLAFVLFLISTFLYGFNVIRPITTKNYQGSKDIWKKSGDIGVGMQKPTGLALSSHIPTTSSGVSRTERTDLEQGTTNNTYTNEPNVRAGNTTLNNTNTNANPNPNTTTTATHHTNTNPNTNYAYLSSNNNSTLQSSSEQYNEKHEQHGKNHSSMGTQTTQTHIPAKTNIIPEEYQQQQEVPNVVNPEESVPQNAYTRN